MAKSGEIPGAAPPPLNSPPPRLRPARNARSDAPKSALAQAQHVVEEMKAKQKMGRWRIGILAAGAVGILVTGSIFGAQLKEARQEQRRRDEIEVAAQGVLQESAPTDQNVPVVAGAAAPQGVARSSDSAPSKQAMDIARQIALLEDRKALVLREKKRFEDKIHMLQERQAQQAEEAARRRAQRQNG